MLRVLEEEDIVSVLMGAKPFVNSS